jgi:hypothetical protein
MTVLITSEQLQARLGADLAGQPTAEALIEDASAVVRQIARTDLGDPVPAVIVAVVAQMVRRALQNPSDLESETIGDYSYQTRSGMNEATKGSALYVTREERLLIREAAERPAVITIPSDTGLLDPWSTATDG